MIKINYQGDSESCFLSKWCLKEWNLAIQNHRQFYKVKKGELIFKEGEDVTGVFFVNEGKVKVHKKWDNDKELIIRFAKNGAILGHRGLGGDARYPVSATALESGVISYISMDFFMATFKVNQEFALKFLLFFADELRESEKKMRNLAHMSVKGRVSRALLALNDQFGSNKEGALGIELTRQDLASYAGATYETVFRIINELVQDQSIKLTGKQITILSREKLLAYNPND